MTLRGVVLVFCSVLSVASECSGPDSRAAPYDETVESISIEADELCVDPAGAPVRLTIVRTLTCVDEDRCGRHHGESITVTDVRDGSDTVQEFELHRDWKTAYVSHCGDWDGRFTGTDPIEGAGRDLGRLQPDCTLAFAAGNAIAGATRDYTLEVSRVNVVDKTATHTCDGQPPYSPPVPVSIRAENVDYCSDGALMALVGTGESTCLSSTKCSSGEKLAFDYALEPYGEHGAWPVVTLANGDTQRMAFHCSSVRAEVRGTLAGREQRLTGSLDACRFAVDEDKVAEAEDTYLRLSISGLDVEAEFPCP